VDINETHDPVMLESMRRARHWRRVIWVLALWSMAWAAIFLEQIISNIDPVRLWMHFLVSATIISPFICIILIPAGLVGRFIGNLTSLRRYRWWISLALPLALCAWPVVSAIGQRIDPALAFKRYLRVDLPKNAREIRTEIFNIALSDPLVTFSFEAQRKNPNG
jgi:hypothetical protein